MSKEHNPEKYQKEISDAESALNNSQSELEKNAAQMALEKAIFDEEYMKKAAKNAGKILRGEALPLEAPQNEFEKK